MLYFKKASNKQLKLTNTHIVLGFIPPVLNWKLLWWHNRNKYEDTKRYNSTIIRSWCSSRTQNPKMESKNEKIYFWKKRLIHIIDLTQTLELTKVALEKVYETISIMEKYYLYQQKSKLQKR